MVSVVRSASNQVMADFVAYENINVVPQKYTRIGFKQSH